MDLSIIIVNWNSIGFTTECLKSIRSTVRNLDYEVIVVDNASSEDAVGILSHECAWVTTIRSDRNIGFAAANNLGFEHSSSKNILFLNPDTVVLGDAIERMVRQLESRDEFAVVGCRLLNADLTLQTTCVQPFPTLANQLLSVDCLRRWWPRLPLWGMTALFSEHHERIHAVEVVCGACLMIRREVFSRVECFSTEYFMYAEEMDLCQKVRQAGWKVGYVPDGSVIHFGGQSTKKKGDGFSDVMIRDSVFRLLRKFRGHAYAYSYRLGMLVNAVLRLLALSGVAAVSGRMYRRNYVIHAWRKWRNIARWTLFGTGRGEQVGVLASNHALGVKS